MRVTFDYYPGGKKKALTMSYDDNTVHDRRLIEIFNKYGIKGTFHICSSWLDTPNHITSDEVPTLYAGHEVASHTVHHASLPHIPCAEFVHEIIDDKKALEALCGYPVRGLSYPNGRFDGAVVTKLRELGVEYSRTTANTGFYPCLAGDPLMLKPTCHHNGDILQKLASLRDAPRFPPLAMFYVWGHSYEFPRDNNWEMIEEFCKTASECTDFWFATNIEIVDYMNALRSLRFTYEKTVVYNPSATAVVISVDGQPLTVSGGETLSLI